MARPKKVMTPEEIEAEAMAKTEKALLKAEKEAAKAAKKMKGNNQELIMPEKRGAWSNPSQSLHTEKMYVEIEFLEPVLGTCPSDPELLETYIASNAPDAPTKAEEIAALGEEEAAKKQTTIFLHGWFIPDGYSMKDPLDRRNGGSGQLDKSQNVRLPFFWNYQVRGMFKDSCGLLSRNAYGKSANLTAFKKIIDGGIMVHPRRIAIETADMYYNNSTESSEPCDSNNLKVWQRPIRITGQGGERTAIASSEEIPAGSRMKFCIELLNPSLRPTVIEWLNYGAVHGMGAWRNSGLGTFRWREVNPDYSPIEG